MANSILWLLSALLAYGICSRTHGKMPNGIFMLFLLLAPLMLVLAVFGAFAMTDKTFATRLNKENTPSLVWKNKDEY